MERSSTLTGATSITTVATLRAPAPSDVRSRAVTSRLGRTALAGALLVMAGVGLFVHASLQARAAAEAADAQARRVHAATRVFVDWLEPAAVSRQLDAMALRRAHLLAEARHQRMRAIALLLVLAGTILLLVAYADRTLRHEVAVGREPDLDLLPSWDAASLLRGDLRDPLATRRTGRRAPTAAADVP